MFTQSAVTNNTEKIRDRLRSIGYDLSCPCCEFEDSFIFTMKDGVCHTFQEEEMPIVFNEIKEKKTDLINCIGNEDLFLAIAALRNDSDINQWFIMDTQEYINISVGDWVIATDINGGNYIGSQITPLCCHKATIEELIEHFKKE